MKIKKLLFFLVVLIITTLFIPSKAEASTEIELDGLRYSLDEGKTATLIGFSGDNTSLDIPSTITNNGEQYTVTKIGDLVFLQCKTLASITIPNTITSMGENVFNRCDNLQEINVANGNTTYSSVNGVLFNYNKTELIRYPEGKKDTTYIIPDTVTQIAESGFWHNQLLVSIEVPNTVTKIGKGAFAFCTSLENITIPNGVTTIGEFMFDNCDSLKSVIIPNTVTTIETYAFNGCESLENITIPNSVTSIEHYAFAYCKSLTEIEIPPTVTNIEGDPFYNCSSLKIYGMKDSMAETIAKDKNITFIVAYYPVIYNLKNISANGLSYVGLETQSYEATLTANTGYKLPQYIKITVDDGENIIDLSSNDFEYDYTTGNLKVFTDEIKGNMEIEAVGEKMIKVIFDANEGEFSNNTNIIKFDDVEDCDFSNLAIPTRNGYKFIGYYTEKTGGTSIEDIWNSEAGIEEDITFYAQWEKIYSYTFIIGQSQIFTLEQIDEYSFKIDGDYKLFNKLVISNLDLVKDIDFVVTEGSTVITFTEKGLAKLNTLAVGNYDVVVEYSNDKEVKGTLTIEANTGNTSSDNDDINTNQPTGSNPQTGDNIMLFVAILGISIIGIVGTTIIRKKLKNN